jgi:NADH-quinone oxidoreductase subunit J
MLAVTHYADWIVFVIASLVVLSGALGVVTASHPVHSALFLIQTLFGVAVLFVAQGAHFLAAVQVIVYAGAIVVLFLFVIMLLGVDRREQVAAEELKGQRPAALVLAAVGLAELVLLSRSNSWASGALSVGGAADGPGSNVEKLGRSLFSTYLLPFEITSALLVIAVVGAVVLARRPVRLSPDEQAAAAEEELAEQEQASLAAEREDATS